MRNKNLEAGVLLSLTTTLKNMIEHMKRVKSMGQFDHWLGQMYSFYEQYKEQFEKTPPGYDRAYSILKHIDKLLEQDRKKFPDDWKDITCKKGCHFCCQQPVVITPDEADLLAECMKHGNLPVDREFLKEQAKLDEETWCRSPVEKRTCVFLTKSGECGVYEYRPGSCRKYYVFNDPKDCEIESHAKDVAVKGTFEVEIALSAAMDLDQKGTDLMPKVLLKALERRGEL